MIICIDKDANQVYLAQDEEEALKYLKSLDLYFYQVRYYGAPEDLVLNLDQLDGKTIKDLNEHFDISIIKNAEKGMAYDF